MPPNKTPFVVRTIRCFISFTILLFIKAMSVLFYRYRIGWPKKRIEWNRVKLIVFLNHTSLFEPVFLGFLPISFLWQLSRRMVAPGADKTLNRPLVGFLYKLFSPGMVSITRKRDNTWDQFLDSINKDSIIIVLPEGRMKRKNGLDLEGHKMTVKPGVVDVLKGLSEGQLLIACSGGLHHIQVPGEGLPKVFKTIKMNIDAFEMNEYKFMFTATSGSVEWKGQVLEDLQHRLETRVPQ